MKVSYATQPQCCTASNAGLRLQLQRVQNKALRICYGVPSYTRIDFLHELAGMPMLNMRMGRLARDWLLKARTNKIHGLEIRPVAGLWGGRGCKDPVLLYFFVKTTRRRRDRGQPRPVDDATAGGTSPLSCLLPHLLASSFLAHH